MISIGKAAFVGVSISAFVYLTLQTHQGQTWLSNLRLWSGNEPQVQVVQKQDSQYRNEIALLTERVDEMQSAIAALKNALQNAPQQEGIHSQVDPSTPITSELDESILLASKPAVEDALANELASVDKLQETQTLQRQQEARAKQFEQQARLQAVVQRMEFTALQVLNR